MCIDTHLLSTVVHLAAGVVQVSEGRCIEGGVRLQHASLLHPGTHRRCAQLQGSLGLLPTARELHSPAPKPAESYIKALRYRKQCIESVVLLPVGKIVLQFVLQWIALL